MSLETQLAEMSFDAFSNNRANDLGGGIPTDPVGYNQALYEFQQAMNTDGQLNPAVNVVGGPQRVDPNTKTLGDRMLSGLQSLKSGFDVDAQSIQNSLLQAEALSVQDMLKVQVDLAKFALRGELMNKTVSQGSQNIDTLLKSQ